MRTPLLPTVTAAIVSLAVLITIGLYFPPSTGIIIALFLGTAFFFFSSFFTLIFYALAFFFSARFINRQTLYYESFRRGLLLSILIIIAATLEYNQALNRLNFILLTTLMFMIEIYFHRYK